MANKLAMNELQDEKALMYPVMAKGRIINERVAEAEEHQHYQRKTIPRKKRNPFLVGVTAITIVAVLLGVVLGVIA